MPIKKIEHIGIAVKSLKEVALFYQEKLRLEMSHIEIHEEQKAKVGFLSVEDVELELLESTSSGGPIAKFIEKNGEGIHHIAFRVGDIQTTLADLKEKGVRLINEQPRIGAKGIKMAFMHPKGTPSEMGMETR